MTGIILAAAKTQQVSMLFALEWLSWIILIAGTVACAIAVLIKLIYVVLSLFPKSETKAKH